MQFKLSRTYRQSKLPLPLGRLQLNPWQSFYEHYLVPTTCQALGWGWRGQNRRSVCRGNCRGPFQVREWPGRHQEDRPPSQRLSWLLLTSKDASAFWLVQLQPTCCFLPPSLPLSLQSPDLDCLRCPSRPSTPGIPMVTPALLRASLISWLVWVSCHCSTLSWPWGGTDTAELLSLGLWGHHSPSSPSFLLTNPAAVRSSRYDLAFDFLLFYFSHLFLVISPPSFLF